MRSECEKIAGCLKLAMGLIECEKIAGCLKLAMGLGKCEKIAGCYDHAPKHPHAFPVVI